MPCALRSMNSEGADAMVAQALSDLNSAVKAVRAFKTARASGETPEVPSVHATNGGTIRLSMPSAHCHQPVFHSAGNSTSAAGTRARS